MQEFTIQELMVQFKKSSSKEIFQEIVERIILNKLSIEEFFEIWKCDIRFKEIILLKAPREVVVRLTLEENITLELIEDRLGDLTEDEAKLMLNSLSADLRKYAVNYAVKHKLFDELLERVCIENNMSVADAILEHMELNVNQANKLLNANLLEVIIYAIKFASKDEVIKKLSTEKKLFLLDKVAIATELKKHHKLTRSDAKCFIDDYNINALFVEFYATRDIVKILTNKEFEYSLVNIYYITNLLSSKKLTQTQLLKLLKTEIYSFKVLAAKLLPKNVLVELLNDKSIDWVTANEILNNLEDYKISKIRSSEILLNSGITRVKLRVLNTSINEAIVANLYDESEEEIIEQSFKLLKKYKLSKEEAQILINAVSPCVRLWASKFASDEILVKKLENESNPLVIDGIMDALKDYAFSSKEVTKFLSIKSCHLRKCILKYAPKEILLETINNKTSQEVLEEAIKLLEKYEFSTEEARRILVHKNSKVRLIAVRFVAVDDLIWRLHVEENVAIQDEIVRQLGDYPLDIVTANNLYMRKKSSMEAVKYIVKYLPKKDVLKYLMDPSTRPEEIKILVNKLEEVL